MHVIYGECGLSQAHEGLMEAGEAGEGGGEAVISGGVLRSQCMQVQQSKEV